MSLLSNFQNQGYIGGSPNSGHRAIVLGGSQYSTAQNALYLAAYTCSDTPEYFVYRSEGNPGSPTLKNAFITTNLSTGKGTIAATAKVGATQNSAIAVCPINNVYLAYDPQGLGTNSIYYSTDQGATWNVISGSTGAINLTQSQDDHQGGASGGWYDGTNYIVGMQAGESFRTTNGTSWSLIGGSNNPLIKPCFAGNNRSAYSGYFFEQNTVTAQDYKYRTAYNATPTTVTGYLLCGMSRNGRYLIRALYSSGQLGYSTDGGASWSVFSNQGYFGSNVNTALRTCWLPSDNGTFWGITESGLRLYYDFSANVWATYGGVSFLPPMGIVFDRGAVGSQECTFFGSRSSTSGSLSGATFAGISDFPRLG